MNEKLWDIEDCVRECEKLQIFDENFISFARSIYILNDKRSNIKKEINKIFDSEIIEEKNYQSYN